MMNFVLVLGEENPVLPGGTWTEYEAEVSDDKLICKQKKDPAVTVEIPYASFRSAEFGIGSGNCGCSANWTGADWSFALRERAGNPRPEKN